eukprot:COSAG01_NODE_1342_length_10639_cov_81.961206_9_plen_162_part_00
MLVADGQALIVYSWCVVAAAPWMAMGTVAAFAPRLMMTAVTWLVEPPCRCAYLHATNAHAFERRKVGCDTIWYHLNTYDNISNIYMTWLIWHTHIIHRATAEGSQPLPQFCRLPQSEHRCNDGHDRAALQKVHSNQPTAAMDLQHAVAHELLPNPHEPVLR